MSRTARDGGFTLIELLVVVFILGILVAIALVSYAVSVSNAKAIACRHNQRVLSEAAAIYQSRTGNEPDDIEDLRAYADKFDRVKRCPADPTVMLEYDPVTGMVTCDDHP